MDSQFVQLWGRRMSNPVGLAAGFDKNGEAVDGKAKQTLQCHDIFIVFRSIRSRVQLGRNWKRDTQASGKPRFWYPIRVHVVRRPATRFD